MGTINLTVQAHGTGWQETGTVVNWTTASGSDDYRWFSTGREILHFKCATGPHTLTVTSQPDSPYGRHGTSNDFAQAVASATEYVSQMFPRAGWADSTGYINIPAPSAQLSFWVEAAPN